VSIDGGARPGSSVGSSSSSPPVTDILYAFLQQKYGVHKVVVEVGYNLVDALKRYSYDADCEMFLKIVFGELCLDCAADQENMVADFVKACQMLDRKQNPGKKKTSGTLSRVAFYELLAAHFEFKAEDDVQALIRAVEFDQPLPMIHYTKLFEETRDGDQGKFAETLRDQHLYGIMSTYPAVEEAIRRAVHIDKGGSVEVSLQRLLDESPWLQFTSECQRY
jgi:hypothetical protein